MAAFGERCSCCMSRFVTVLALMAVAYGFAAEPVIDCVKIHSQSKANPQVTVWYRAPRNYGVSQKMPYRVLVLFGGRNCDGKSEVSGKLGWPEWADLNSIFLVAPTLKDDVYWQPEKWSGKALLNALDLIALKYRISKKGLLYYGYSAGSQASNLFPAWRPDLACAYVSHACGVFHEPSLRMKNVAGLVTCGDADIARYVLSREFVGKYRKLGISVIWKSFPNHPHDVPPGSIRLAKEFLADCHWRNPGDIDGEWPASDSGEAFVGDDADGLYYPAGSPEAGDIKGDDRVYLPSSAIASAWGRPGSGVSVEKSPKIETNRVCEVDVVVRIPASVTSESRILVLLGGRGWTGERSMKELCFSGFADEKKWCILAPSFSKGTYWEPKSGSAYVIQKSIEQLRSKVGLRPLPVFLFGYSAGGQLVALLQAESPFPIAGWGVFGCGVFPDSPTARSPGFVGCGIGDAERYRLSREFAYRYRESGGMMLWKPVSGGHEMHGTVLEIARQYFTSVAGGGECRLWGEDDTKQIRNAEEIDVEFRNPLFDHRLAGLWQK